MQEESARANPEMAPTSAFLVAPLRLSVAGAQKG